MLFQRRQKIEPTYEPKCTMNFDVTAFPHELICSTATLFGVLASPLRLQIISRLADSERNVGELLAVIATTQPNMSNHLKALFNAGIAEKRRVGVQIYYHLANPHLCLTLFSLSRTMGKQS